MIGRIKGDGFYLKSIQNRKILEKVDYQMAFFIGPLPEMPKMALGRLY
tara:strand:+ start:4116 stop:4259 length:144 start_codon:yes stop_codon:yes gene_type:complete